MDELENLLKHLGIQDAFDVLGHSWGGMLAGEWAATRHPKGLGRIVLTCAPVSMQEWEKAAAALLLQMPQDIQDVINKAQKDKKYDTPE